MTEREDEMEFLTQVQAAQKVRCSVNTFATKVKQQAGFPKPIKTHPTSHYRWKEVDIDNWLNRA